ncbi:MAG: NRDE family protein [Bradymonadaceae bacterium]|nr:NRDE family protein [Lujinxingiaceae bacterium]
MCTLIIAVQVLKDCPLWIAANRDEVLERPAAPPSIDSSGAVALLAPRDLEAGGTWLGLNACGLFAGITNRFAMVRQPGHRSRGLIVLDALAERSAAAAADRIAASGPGDHNGFHLVVADEKEAFLVWNDGLRLQRRRLSPGVHVITERSLGAGESRRITRLEEDVQRWALQSASDTAALVGFLARHDEHDEPLESTCVHFAALNYGTRSSSIVSLGAQTRFLHADGPPCKTPYVDFSEQAEALMKTGC